MTERERRRFESFAREVRPDMVRIARRMCRGGVDPEDLVQEALARVLKLLQGGSTLEPLDIRFVSAVMGNHLIDVLRRQRSLVPMEESFEGSYPAPGREEEVWRKVTDEQLEEAMGALKPRLREVCRLHREGHRYRAIAQMLHIAEGTVGADLTEARRQLRQLLEVKVSEGEVKANAAVRAGGT